MQGSSRDTGIEKRLVDTAKQEEDGLNWETSIETYTLPYVREIVSGNLLFDTRAQPCDLWRPRGVAWGKR